jgi:hypothetical protein
VGNSADHRRAGLLAAGGQNLMALDTCRQSIAQEGRRKEKRQKVRI